MADVRIDQGIVVEQSTVDALNAAAEIIAGLSRDKLLMLRGYAAGLKANVTTEGGTGNGKSDGGG